MRMLLPTIILSLIPLSAAQAQFSFDATIEGDLGLRQVCEGVVTPVPKIRNIGTEVMVACVVETWKNGFQVNSFDWQLTAPAGPGQLRQPVLPEVSDVETGDVIELRIISVNENADEGPEGNSRSIEIQGPLAQAGTYLVEATLTTPGAAKLDWYLRDVLGNTVYSEVALVLLSSDEHVAWVELAPATCYSIEVVNYGGGDDVSLSLRSGGLEVVALSAEEVAAGMRSGFVTGVVSSVPTLGKEGPVRIEWSTTDGTLRVNSVVAAKGLLQVFDASGRCVLQRPLTVLPGTTTIPVADFANGVYTTRFVDDSGKASSRRFVQAHP